MPTGKGYRRGQSAAGNGERLDAYQQVTDRVIAALEEGRVPWREPWAAGGWPSSMSSGKQYRGVNPLLLGFTEFPSKWWGTYRQIDELGGQVRKGEKSSLVVFFKELVKDDPDNPTESGDPGVKRIPMLRTFRVFNYCQADGLPERFAPRQIDGRVEPDANAERVIGDYLAAGNAASLIHDVHGMAHYIPADDTIHVPPAGEHISGPRYYSTLFHELAHSTGHGSRLARPTVCETGKYKGHDRGVEELTAEMGACFLLNECGITDPEAFAENTNYVGSWLDTIRGDKRLVVQAASAAQKAADMIAEPSRQAAPVADMEAA